LLSKEGQIEQFYVPEAQAAHALWFCHIFPRNPARSPFPLLAAPPEVPKMAINVLTQAPRQHEIGHRVRQDRLSHYLDENFFTTRRQALFHLAFATSLDLVLQILECS